MPEDSRWLCHSSLCLVWFLLQPMDSRTEKLLQQPKHLELSQGKPLAVGAHHICPLSHTLILLLPARRSDAHGTWWREEDQRDGRCSGKKKTKKKQPLTPSAKWKILENRGLKMKKTWRVESKKEGEKENGGGKWKPKITGKRWQGNFLREKRERIRGGWREWRGKKKRCGVSAAGPEAQGTTASLADSLAHFFSLALAVWPTTLLGCRQPLTPPLPLAAGWRLADAAQHCIAGEGQRPPSLPPSAPPPPRQTKTTLLPPLCPSSASAIPTRFTLIIVHTWHPTLCRVYSSG